MILIEEVKECLSTNIKTCIEEQKAETLRQAARLADDYSLTHHGVFKGSPSESNSAGGSKSEPSKNADHMNKPSTRIKDELCHQVQYVTIANARAT